MPRLTPGLIQSNIEILENPEMQDLRDEDIRRDWIYHGKIRDVVLEALFEEFKKPESIVELNQRMIPINIVQKIVNKLSMVYKTAPMRKSADGNEDDNELIQVYEDGLKINRCMKTANRHFKLYKRALVEIYLNKFGIPSLRTIPRGSYEVFSTSAIDPQIPDTVLKILAWDHDPAKRVYEWWTDEDFLITNGKGEPDLGRMGAMGNTTGSNPFGVLPFTYINESDTQLIPLPDDDLLKVGVAIPLLLSDLSFASKYQAWSMIYTIGVDGEIPINPNSVVNLEYGPDGERPEINQVKPEVDIDQMLRMIEAVLAFLLSTKSLSAGSIQGQLTTKNAASGISKMLDESESMEDREDQQQYFVDAENDIWNKLSKNLIPFWRKRRLLEGKYNDEFSKDFELSIHFPEVKIVKSEKEKLEEAAFRIEKGFSTKRRELKRLNPGMSETEIEQLLDEIEEEKEMAMERVLEIGDDNDDEENDDDGE
jgi:hypothetical protein